MDDRFWIDGEWIAPYEPFEENGSELERLEYEAQLEWDYPRAADKKLIRYFLALVEIAKNYFEETGRHLNVYGDIGELYGSIAYGISLNRMFAEGADGRLGDDHIEIKTISPLSGKETKTVRRAGNWNRLLLVKIDSCFDVRGYLLDKKALPRKGQKVRISWDSGLADKGVPL